MLNIEMKNTHLVGLFLFLVAMGKSHADVIELDNAALAKLQSEGVAIIDVRRLDEWQETGLVEGSHPLTFFDAKGKYDAAAWIDKLNQIVKPDQPVVLICARGVRSSKIADLLDKRLGYSAVHNVTDGILSWLKDNKPVVAYTVK